MCVCFAYECVLILSLVCLSGVMHDETVPTTSIADRVKTSRTGAQARVNVAGAVSRSDSGSISPYSACDDEDKYSTLSISLKKRKGSHKQIAASASNKIVKWDAAVARLSASLTSVNKSKRHKSLTGTDKVSCTIYLMFAYSVTSKSLLQYISLCCLCVCAIMCVQQKKAGMNYFLTVATFLGEYLQGSVSDKSTGLAKVGLTHKLSAQDKAVLKELVTVFKLYGIVRNCE
jgi:hypothetical protein